MCMSTSLSRRSESWDIPLPTLNPPRSQFDIKLLQACSHCLHSYVDLFLASKSSCYLVYIYLRKTLHSLTILWPWKIEPDAVTIAKSPKTFNSTCFVNKHMYTFAQIWEGLQIFTLCTYTCVLSTLLGTLWGYAYLRFQRPNLQSYRHQASMLLLMYMPSRFCQYQQCNASVRSSSSLTI